MSEQNSTQEGFTPFDANVVERSYTKPNVDGNAPIDRVGEPIFDKPSIESLNAGLRDKLEETFEDKSKDKSSSSSGPSSGGSSSGPTSGGPSGKFSEPKGSANPSMSQLDNSEKKKAAMTMVEAALDGYSGVNSLANRLMMFNPKKMDKLIKDGEVNPNIKLNIDGHELTVPTFIEKYNKNAEGTIYVSEEFKQKVTPVMLRVFLKYDVGMSDEALLAYYFGRDVLEKGVIIYGMRQQLKGLTEELKEQTLAMRSGTAPSPNPSNNSSSVKEPVVSESKSETVNAKATPATGTNSERFFEEVKSDAKKERVYVEPEEVVIQDDAEFSEAIITNNDAPGTGGVVLPEFGDRNLLAHMEEVANKSTVKKGRKNNK